MLLYIVLLFTLLAILIAYIFFIKPYLTIKTLKNSFQSKGYKVLVRDINFTKQIVTPQFKRGTEMYYDCFHDYKNLYQNYDISIENVFNKIWVTIINIDLVKQYYKKFQSFEKSKFLRNNFARVNGGGLLFTQQNQWKSKRKLYSQIFNFKLLEELHSNIQKISQKTINKWKTQENIDLLTNTRELFFNIFVSSYFGREFQEFQYKNQSYAMSIVHLFDKIFGQVYSTRYQFLGRKFLQAGYTKVDKQIQEDLNIIKNQTKEFVIKRLKEIQQKNNNGKNGQEQSILAKVVYNQDFKNLSVEQKNQKIDAIVGDVMIFFFAGTDTTSAAMIASLHLLYKNPQVLEKLLDQLRNSPQDYSPSTIKNLKYMDAVFNETLRLHGPANALFSRIPKDHNLTLGDVKIPNNCIFLVQSYSTHCSQKYYEKPYQFIPERWVNKQNQVPFSFLPFSSGPRNCIGQHLARVQFKIALSMFLRKFNFKTDQIMTYHRPLVYCSQNNHFTISNRNL